MFIHGVRDKLPCMMLTHTHTDMTGQCEDISITLCLRLCKALSVAGRWGTSEILSCLFGSVSMGRGNIPTSQNHLTRSSKENIPTAPGINTHYG